MEDMLAAVQEDARETGALTGLPRFHDRVMAALAAVPRHEFVGPRERDHAYDNTPLPIGEGQTISQPFVVALMTELLDIGEPDGGTRARILEIGTGCGYQAAVLAALGAEVYSIEVLPTLAAAAAERLARLGYSRVQVRAGQGRDGWAEAGPFDGIIVTAAGEVIPQALIDQLAAPGRLVAPVGPDRGAQELVVVEKTGTGETRQRTILPVAFVPLREGPP